MLICLLILPHLSGCTPWISCCIADSPLISQNRLPTVLKRLSCISYNLCTGVVLIGTVAASEKIVCIHNETKGVFNDWVSTIMHKMDNHHWTDEQIERLIVECSCGRAWQALDLLSQSALVLYCMEDELYSDVKQTVALLKFNTLTIYMVW